MTIADLFSKRQQKIRPQAPNFHQHAQVPRPLRAEIAHILRDLFGHEVTYDLNGCLEAFGEIEQAMCREYGLCILPTKPTDLTTTPDVRVIDFLLYEEDQERVLDVVEVSFRLMARLRSSPEWQSRVSQEKFDRAVTELNARFREYGIGYQYENGEIVKVESQLIHAEVVKPAVALLNAAEYAEANAEFLRALEHYRKGETKECLNECLKTFESTMKAICLKRKWAFKPKDTAKELIDVCLKNGLTPPLIHSHIRGVRATLARGIPTIRNGRPGHGQEVQLIDVPPHYAGYMLHLTAATIQFLVESEKAFK
jgi:AbiJ N-terminal domain 4